MRDPHCGKRIAYKKPATALGFLFALVLGLVLGGGAQAADITVAVAANFTAPAKEIAAAFQGKTGFTADLSFGSSGQLYAQIANGAPFDIFLSADAERPLQAEKAGLAVAGTRFTYAVGKLVLWSATPGLVDDAGSVLAKGNFNHIAIANPTQAPYGAAAQQVLKAKHLDAQLSPKIVTGENIGQTFQFIASGNAELGFVALSQLADNNSGSRWVVPETLYSPILQDGALLKTGGDKKAARAFLDFLKGPEAAKIIQRFGYGNPRGA